MAGNQLERVRRLCLALPDTSEKLSHGEPTFFVHKKVYRNRVAAHRANTLAGIHKKEIIIL